MGFLEVCFNKRERMFFVLLISVFTLTVILLAVTQAGRITIDDYDMKVLNYHVEYKFSEKTALITFPDQQISAQLSIENLKTLDEMKSFLIRLDSAKTTMIISMVIIIFLTCLLILLRRQKESYRHGMLKGLFSGVYIIPVIFFTQGLFLFLHYKDELHHALDHIII